MSRFGCWNIRSMSGREEELVDKMKRYRFKVLGVNEAKMRGNGIRRIGDATCVYSEVQEGRSKAGVGACCQRSLEVSQPATKPQLPAASNGFQRQPMMTCVRL